MKALNDYIARRFKELYVCRKNRIMSASDVKLNLLKLILETEDTEVLEELTAYFRALRSKSDWWKEISEKEKALVKIGLDQLEKGEGIAYESVKEKARQLLAKPQR